MAKLTFTPEPHQVYNEFDNHGLLMSLGRLELERNAAYKRRLLDVYVHRASSTYIGLIHGITRELGLNLVKTLRVVPVVDGDGVPLLPFPAVVFEHTKCTLYSDYTDDDVLLELDRYDLDSDAWSLDGLVDQINATGYFTATLYSGVSGVTRSMTIFNQSSVNIVPSEDISGRGSRVKLDNENLVEGTVSVSSDNLTERVDTEIELVKSGQYVVDLEEGVILTTSVPSPGSAVRYSYRNDDFIVMSSPVIIHNLQSSDFRTKMFEEIDEETLGRPTTRGAFIINELLSVFPSSWGP
jgi:hypothetical protein